MEAAANSRRRRGLGVVTANACTECRKKRAKCDGQTPCGRCSSQGAECIYEVPVRQSKEHMRTEIEQLRTQQRSNDRILAALIQSDRPEDILDQLRNGETTEKVSEKLESIASRSTSGSNVTTFDRISDHQAIGSALRTARSIASSPLSLLASSDKRKDSTDTQGPIEGNVWPSWGGEKSAAQDQSDNKDDSAMNWEPDATVTTEQSRTYPLVGTWHSGADTQGARESGQGVLLGRHFGTDDTDLGHGAHPHSWTKITSDVNFVEHIMALYFCWEYPTFASLSKEHFLDDFRTGRPRHCSELLVNALLALGCRFSSQARARANPNDSNTAGDHFYAEAQRLLVQMKDRHNVTTIQALGLMSIREASCGRSSQSLFLSGQSIRLAIEMGLHSDVEPGKTREAEIEHAVRSATFWGAFSLDQAWSLSIGRLPHFSKDTKLVTKPALVEHVEATSWVPYTDEGEPVEKSCRQPSNVRSVFKTFCELSEIVHRSLYALYAPGADVTGQALIAAYTEHLHWYESIPTTLRLGQNFTPAVLFAHMYYHFAILLLFRPFIKLDLINSQVSPRDVCRQAADAISALVNSYSKLYTLGRTPSFVPFFVLTSGIAHLVTLDENAEGGAKKVDQCIQDLKEMMSGHGFAVKALDILRYLVFHWKIEQPLGEFDEGRDWKELCRPSSTSLNLFCPQFDSVDGVSKIGTTSPDENPLFWPFPLQGRPLLGAKLEEAGFKLAS